MSQGKNTITFYQQGMIEIVEGEGKVSFPEHSHLSYMIGAVLSGSMHMKIGEQTYEMKEGMIYLIPSNTVMSMEYITPVVYLSICLKEELAEIFNACRLKSNVMESGGERLKEICVDFKQNGEQELYVQRLMSLLQMEPCAELGAYEYSDFVEKAIRYINEHAEEKWSIEELAEQLHVSKFHFCRTFKKEVGVSPKQFQQQTRLRYMKTRILQEGSETRLAEDMEFAAQSHMCTLFKKYMGISIREYKNSLTIK